MRHLVPTLANACGGRAAPARPLGGVALAAPSTWVLPPPPAYHGRSSPPTPAADRRNEENKNDSAAAAEEACRPPLGHPLPLRHAGDGRAKPRQVRKARDRRAEYRRLRCSPSAEGGRIEAYAVGGGRLERCRPKLRLPATQGSPRGNPAPDSWMSCASPGPCAPPASAAAGHCRNRSTRDEGLTAVGAMQEEGNRASGQPARPHASRTCLSDRPCDRRRAQTRRLRRRLAPPPRLAPPRAAARVPLDGCEAAWCGRHRRRLAWPAAAAAGLARPPGAARLPPDAAATAAAAARLAPPPRAARPPCAAYRHRTATRLAPPPRAAASRGRPFSARRHSPHRVDAAEAQRHSANDAP